jgi:uroporphyrinogen decarboxylase
VDSSGSRSENVPCEWTSRKRMVTAYRHGQADRVPVCPDISLLIPARLTGRPFWEVFLYSDPPAGVAYLDAVRFFGIDGLYWYDDLDEIITDERPRWHSHIEVHEDRHLRIEEAYTPHGVLTRVEMFPKDDAPWVIVKPIKELEPDFHALKLVMGECDWQWVPRLKNRDLVGETCIYECEIQTPIDWWFSIRDGGYEKVFTDLFGQADFMRTEVFGFYYRWVMAKLEAMLLAKPDAIWLGGSGSSLSVSSPRFYRTYDLPLVQAVSKRCREAGIPSHQHTCGRSAKIVEINGQETELDVMEPLEGPPGGDVDLGQVKRRFGDRLCLKGNLNTFEFMLRATPLQVKEAAKACIDVAAAGGGYVLSTGDQCARDTPFANIAALVEVADMHGKY